MIRGLIFNVLILCVLCSSGYAQQEIEVNSETWWGVMTSAQISKRFALWNDAHFVDELFFIYRTGLTYHPKADNFVTTFGYGFLKLRAPFSEGRLVRPEHRPWMQTIYRVPPTKKTEHQLSVQVRCAVYAGFGTGRAWGGLFIQSQVAIQ
jgi:hypothetical protein